MAVLVPIGALGGQVRRAARAVGALVLAGCANTAMPGPDTGPMSGDATVVGDAVGASDALPTADAACSAAGTRWCESGRVVLAGPACATPVVAQDCLWNGKHCQFGHCLDEPCNADNLGCDGGRVVRCKAGKVEVVDDCAVGGGVCAKGACTHPQCAKYPQTCTGGAVWTCNPKSGAYDISGGSCAAPDLCTGVGCLPGCSGGYTTSKLQCSPDGKAAYDCGNGYSTFPVSITVCTSPTTLCAGGKCIEPCKAKGDTCLDGKTVQHCIGEPVPTTAACGEPTPDCLDGKCVRLCKGGPSAACVGAGWQQNTAAVCDGGPVAKLTTCGSGLCQAGKCFEKQCSYLDKQCKGGEIQQCSYDGQWSAPQPCPTGTFCAGGACVIRPCAIGATGCQGQMLATCGTSTVQIGAACPEGSVCEGGACLGNCSANWAGCDESTARNCANGMPVVSKPCTAAGQTCAVLFGQAECAACDGQIGCAGAWAIGCQYTSKYNQYDKTKPKAWCPPPAKCAAGSCSAPEVANKCAKDVMCQGDALLRCNPATGKLEQETLCAGAYTTCSEAWSPGCDDSDCHLGLSTCVGNAVEACTDVYHPPELTSCAADQVCQDGGCLKPACKPPNWPDVPGLRVVALQWLPAGQGCDLDGQPGADNQAHKLATWLPPQSLQAGLALGAVATFAQLANAATPTLQLFAAWQEPPPFAAAWSAMPETFDRTAQTAQPCPARTLLSQGTDGWFYGGKAVQWLPLRISSAEIRLPLAQMRGKLTDGPAPGTKTLTVCGWSPKLHFNQLTAHLPIQVETLLGVTAKQLHDALDEALLPLGDPDGDGIADATPLAFQLTLKQ